MILTFPYLALPNLDFPDVGCIDIASSIYPRRDLIDVTADIAYRLDYIRNIELLSAERRRPIREIMGCRDGLNLSEYMKEHIYMYGGKSERVTFRAGRDIIGHIVDWFGKDTRFSNETEDAVTVTVTVNEQSMLYWALQYGMSVEILKPAELRERVRDAVEGMWKKYNE
jgi:predicted DNA-binding transcriptional regulator YafY